MSAKKERTPSPSALRCARIRYYTTAERYFIKFEYLLYYVQINVFIYI